MAPPAGRQAACRHSGRPGLPAVGTPPAGAPKVWGSCRCSVCSASVEWLTGTRQGLQGCAWESSSQPMRLCKPRRASDKIRIPLHHAVCLRQTMHASPACGVPETEDTCWSTESCPSQPNTQTSKAPLAGAPPGALQGSALTAAALLSAGFTGSGALQGQQSSCHSRTVVCQERAADTALAQVAAQVGQASPILGCAALKLRPHVQQGLPSVVLGLQSGVLHVRGTPTDDFALRARAAWVCGGGRHQSQRFTLKLRSPGETTTAVAYILQDSMMAAASCTTMRGV